MKEYIENNRLTLEADEGKVLTDGEALFVSKYEFPVGVEENNLLYEITEAEYEALIAEEAATLPFFRG